MDSEPAGADDFQHFLDLAAEVEDWFGPMVDEPGFHDAVLRNIGRGSALVALDARQAVGALMFSWHRAPVYEIGWLVVTASRRSEGIGGALVAHAVREWIRLPAVLDVVTFGAGHLGAGSRRFYERHRLRVSRHRRTRTRWRPSRTLRTLTRATSGLGRLTRPDEATKQATSYAYGVRRGEIGSKNVHLARS